MLKDKLFYGCRANPLHDDLAYSLVTTLFKGQVQEFAYGGYKDEKLNFIAHAGARVVFTLACCANSLPFSKVIVLTVAW
jgi:hypothetical protein